MEQASAVQSPLELTNGDLSIDLSAYATTAELAEKQNALAVEEPPNLTNDVLSLGVDTMQAPEAGGGGRPLIYNDQVLKRRAGSNLFTLDQYALNCLDVGVIDSPAFDIVSANGLNLGGVNVGATLTNLSDAVANPNIDSVVPPLAVDAEGELSINLSAYARDSDLTSVAADVAGKQDALTAGSAAGPHAPVLVGYTVQALVAGPQLAAIADNGFVSLHLQSAITSVTVDGKAVGANIDSIEADVLALETSKQDVLVDVASSHAQRIVTDKEKFRGLIAGATLR
jgi:hypothetical protein